MGYVWRNWNWKNSAACEKKEKEKYFRGESEIVTGRKCWK